MKGKYLIKVTRKKESHDFKFDKKKNDFKNNIKNNSLDILEIYLDNLCLFVVDKVQTVCNHPHFDYFDTISPGKFKLKCFVDPRNFHGQIHGIIDAYDLDKEKIDLYSMQIDDGYQKGRWLVHDRWSFKKNRDLYNAYSGGCFMMDSRRLKRFNSKLKTLEFTKGDVINGILEEV